MTKQKKTGHEMRYVGFCKNIFKKLYPRVPKEFMGNGITW